MVTEQELVKKIADHIYIREGGEIKDIRVIINDKTAERIMGDYSVLGEDLGKEWKGVYGVALGIKIYRSPDVKEDEVIAW